MIKYFSTSTYHAKLSVILGLNFLIKDMRLKFASWNLNRRRPQDLYKDIRLEILQAYKPDIIALQEVSRSFYALLDYDKMFSWSAFSLESNNPRPDGCALFGTGLFKPISSQVMKNVPFPEQTMISRLESPAGLITACSFHIPNGSRHKDKKRVTGRVIAEWLAQQKLKTIFGIDANSPAVDHPDVSKSVLYENDAPELLGFSGKSIHNLRDAFRISLESNPEMARLIVAQRPNGPLAVSYDRGNNVTRVERRYDHIYITPDIKVIKVEYHDLLPEASDHALVVAELEVSEN